MKSEHDFGASSAPSLTASRRARIEASGVPSALSPSLIAIAFAAPKRDDVAMLASVTQSRCAAASVGGR